MLRSNADVRRCSYFELGLPVVFLILILWIVIYVVDSAIHLLNDQGMFSRSKNFIYELFVYFSLCLFVCLFFFCLCFVTNCRRGSRINNDRFPKLEPKVQASGGGGGGMEGPGYAPRIVKFFGF